VPAIVLATVNARWAHASLALRYLRANLGELRADAALCEFTLAAKPQAIVDRLLDQRPRLIGFGVYIWNVEHTTRVIELLKARAPQVTIVVGGPEVSHEVDDQRICRLADFVVTGWGDLTFAKLARQVLHGPRPLMKVHAGEQPPMHEIAAPYDEYTDDDLRHRHVYVEASRGCPFRCEFCLSALDRTAWPFALDALLADLDRLYRRGARDFRFVDRTFNLKVETAQAILRFFLDRIEAGVEAAPRGLPFVHFELIPDHLPPRLKAWIARFPPGTLQLEIGIQTWNPDVQALVSRRQDNGAAQANLQWLRSNTNAHLHVDLIAGLPGEDLASFGAGFDRLVRLAPHEVQVGILKRLRGAPISRHTAACGLVFNPRPPYDVLETDRIDAGTMRRLARFARYWDLIANSGRFACTLPLLLGAAPFARFLAWSDALHRMLGRTHGIALEQLYECLHTWFAAAGHSADATEALRRDYADSGARGRLSFAAPVTARRRPVATAGGVPPRQWRHLKG
jgi:radical SAM superfamily enzyme YgiQ (UPF0313 family)